MQENVKSLFNAHAVYMHIFKIFIYLFIVYLNKEAQPQICVFNYSRPACSIV